MQCGNSFNLKKMNKIYIPRYVYGTYASIYCNKLSIGCFNLKFKDFFERHLKEIYHTDLITKWTRNLDKAAYKEKLKTKTHKPSLKKSIITIVENIYLIVLAMIFYEFYSGCFELYKNDIINHADRPILK